jgi:hypothetical protein
VVGIGWNWAATLGDREQCAALYRALLPMCVSPDGYATIEEAQAVIEERQAETEEQWGYERDYKRLSPGQKYCLVAAALAQSAGAVRTHIPASPETMEWGMVFGGETINNSDAITETIKKLARECAG